MGLRPFRVVEDFESALCAYTGAPFAVTTTSCTMALLLAVAWFLRHQQTGNYAQRWRGMDDDYIREIEIPRYTYVSVPMSIIHAGGRPCFRDEVWAGCYQLCPLPVWDYARLLTSGMYRAGDFQCVSFHWGKTLGIQQGGAILHDSPEADAWLRRARFDGRASGVAPRDDTFSVLGWHAYMAPETAAAGLMRLALLPRHNEPLSGDDYPDLSKMEIFQ